MDVYFLEQIDENCEAYSRAATVNIQWLAGGLLYMTSCMHTIYTVNGQSYNYNYMAHVNGKNLN